MPVTAGALITSICINGSVGLACFSLFAVLRQWRVTAKLYKPKRYVGAENVAGAKPQPLAQELPAGFISWIKPVWCYKEADVIDLCGLDVAVFFRMLQLGVKLFTFISLWCLLVVMPVNMTGGFLERKKKRRPVGTLWPGDDVSSSSSSMVSWPGMLLDAALNFSSSSTDGYFDDSQAPFAGGSAAAAAAPAAQGVVHLGNVTDVIHSNLDLLTLSNVYPGSGRMWVHLASTYIITLVALKLLWDLSRDIAFKRAVFLAVQGRTGPGSSVLVCDIPGLSWGTPLNRLNLSWLQWLLPRGLFRHGYEHKQQQRQQQQSRQQLPQGETQQQLMQPLLPHGGSPHATDHTVAAPAGSSRDSSSVIVEVTNGAGGSSSSGGGQAGTHGASAAAAASTELTSPSHDEPDVGPPAVKDVWQEAVEVLQGNGGDVKAMVRQEMARVYGADNIAAVVTVHDTRALDAAAAQLCALQEQLEDVLDWYQYRLPPLGVDLDTESQQQQLQQQRGKKGTNFKRKTVLVVGARYGSWGIDKYGVAPVTVDALEFYPSVLQQRVFELQQLQQAALRHLPRPAAVVTFRRQLVATLAAASLHSYDEAAWSISPAPAPQEMLWATLGMRSWEVSMRQFAVWIAFWCLVLFYAPIVAAIQAPVNMDNLKKIPFLSTLLQLPLVASLVQGFLPSLVLLTFLAVLPYLLAALIRKGGLHSLTAEDTLLTLMYFVFQLFAVFIFSFVSGTALSQLQAIIDNPRRIISLLGVGAPQQASFFSTYILLLGLSRMPVQLLRLPELALYLLKRQLADSPRQRRRLWANQEQLLGRVLPLHTLTLLLGLVFCVASPLIAPFTLLYFVSSSICQRYQWLYVYRHPYEGAGTLWKQVFTQVLVSVYFFVAVMGCLLGIKRFEAAFLLLPLAVGVLVFHVLAGRLLERPLTLAPSREAAAMDAYVMQHEQGEQHAEDTRAADSKAGDAAAGDAGQTAAAAAGIPNQVADVTPRLTQSELSELYTSPAMKLSSASLQPLLEEAADIERRLRAAGW